VLVVTLAGRWLLAVVLVAAAVAKLGQAGPFGEAIERYGLLPRSAVPIAARVLPVVELLLGAALAAGVLVAAAAVACGCLFGVFGAAVAVSLARGRRFDCGCGLSADAEITWWHVGRSVVLVGLGVLIAVEPAVLAINASRVGGAPAANELVAVPLGVLLLCITWRLVAELRRTASLVRESGSLSELQ
jgi:uncharacterized membrane protein YphA (DoxX/SURF4 family)